MKSKQNDAQLIAEAYAKVEVQEEALGAIAAGAGRAAAAAGRGLAKAATSEPVKKVVKGTAKLAGKAAKQTLKTAGMAAGGAIAGAAEGAAHSFVSDEEKEDKLETALAKGDIDEKDAREIKKHREEDAEHEGHSHEAPEEVDMSQAPDPESLEVHSEPVADEVAVGNEERVNHHDDSEIKMALSELYKIEKYAFGLSLMLKELPALEGWTASKITKAADYLGSVFHKLDYDFASGEAPVHHEDECGYSHEDSE